jgi:hypothetical protein
MQLSKKKKIKLPKLVRKLYHLQLFNIYISALNFIKFVVKLEIC